MKAVVVGEGRGGEGILLKLQAIDTPLSTLKLITFN